MLFPLTWVKNHSGGFGDIFDALFRAEWVHISMHMILYAGLAIFIILVVKRPLDLKLLLALTCLALGVGVLQEWLQMIVRGNTLPYALFDLGVDLTGAYLGAGFFLLFQSHSKRKRLKSRLN